VLLSKALYLTCFTPPRCNGKLLGDNYNLSAKRSYATVAPLLKQTDSDVSQWQRNKLLKCADIPK
jgi:hypothetical protein